MLPFIRKESSLIVGGHTQLESQLTNSMGNGQYTPLGIKYEYQKERGTLNSSHFDE